MEYNKKKTNNPWLRAALFFLAKISGLIALSALIGVLGGKWLDTYFETTPVIMIVLTAIGFGLSLWGIFREIKTYNNSL